MSLFFTGVLLFYLSFSRPSTLYKHRCCKPYVLGFFLWDVCCFLKVNASLAFFFFFK